MGPYGLEKYGRYCTCGYLALLSNRRQRRLSFLRRDHSIAAQGGVAVFIKAALSYETVANSVSWDEQLEVFAFKIHGPRNMLLDAVVVLGPLSNI